MGERRSALHTLFPSPQGAVLRALWAGKLCLAGSAHFPEKLFPPEAASRLCGARKWRAEDSGVDDRVTSGAQGQRDREGLTGVGCVSPSFLA